ncbi:serine hydrolase domain-containing protein [Nakamurella flava]|uniref:serine hydrolase domain-containing protein n=1 Tax=Nakamurella flava TaxID=2576308 RepID=UPI001408C436|nr:serine hydrolase domain-containing protein [Nakamurella flava]
MRRGAVAGVVVAVVLATGGAIGWHLATRAPVVELLPPRSAAVAVSAVSAAAAHVTAVPGVAVGAVVDGQVAWIGQAGVPAGTVFQAGSISKTVAAATVLTLAGQGRLDLDAPVTSMLRSWSPAGFPHPERVTLRALLSHTAGIDTAGYLGEPADRPLPMTADSLAGATTGAPVRQSLRPGSYAYSGGGYTIAQQVVEDVTGRPFAEVARSEFLQPTGLTDSGYGCTQEAETHPRDTAGHLADGTPAPRYRYVEAAAAGWCTTAADLTRLAAWLASNDPRAVDMRSPAAGTDGRYGLGVERWGSDVVGHPGVNRGFHADLWVRPAAGAALVVLTNGDDGGRAADAIRDAWNDAA